MNALEKKYSPPIVDEESRPFWTRAREGGFLIKHCRECDQPHWYPRSRCPFCMSDDTVWKEAAGTGVIYSYSVMRRSTEPYIVAFVTLDEGPRVLTNIVECDPNNLRIGMRVVMAFRHPENDDGETAIVVFRPAMSSETGTKEEASNG